MRIAVPGTVLRVEEAELKDMENRFCAMFLPGDMVLSQVAGITGLEPYTVQNWVKRGFLSPPVKKRYTLRQLCRILHINMLKAALPMEDICGLLQYVNGKLEDESDDLIDDSVLYFLFLRLAYAPAERREEMIGQLLDEYREPVPGAKERVGTVLDVMLTAWDAARLRAEAEEKIRRIKA